MMMDSSNKTGQLSVYEEYESLTNSSAPFPDQDKTFSLKTGHPSYIRV